MTKTIITTDSGLNPIDTTNMIPGIILSKGEEYYDTVKLNKDDMIKKISSKEIFERRLKGEKFTTSSPSYVDYMKLFIKYIVGGYNVIHLSTSSSVSAGSVNIPYNIIKHLDDRYHDNIHLIDTLTAGSGGTLINLIAHDLLAKGLDNKEIVSILEDIKKDIFSSYYISEFSGYRESGRVPYGTKVFDVLNFRYRIDINEKGALFPKKFYRGTINTTSKKYIEEIINDKTIDNYMQDYLILLNMPLDKIDKEEIINYIRSFNYFKNIVEGDFYGTISAYGVKDQLGIAMLRRKK